MKTAKFYSVRNGNGIDGETGSTLRGVVTVGEDGKAVCTQCDDNFKQEYCRPMFDGQGSVEMDDGEKWCRAVQARFSICSNFFVVLE